MSEVPLYPVRREEEGPAWNKGSRAPGAFARKALCQDLHRKLTPITVHLQGYLAYETATP
jgi:hypothetical protein